MANLDVTLDDRIKLNGSSRTGPRRPGSDSTRRFPNRAAPYSFSSARAPVAQWDHGMYGEELPEAVPEAPRFRGGDRISAIETGTRLLISNLDFGVSDDDITELFSDVGDLKRCLVNYDRSGRSEGTAEVVFTRRRDAEAAIKRYNNVQLDGKPMRIEIVGISISQPPILPPASYDGYRRNNVGPIRNSRVQGRNGERFRGGHRGMRKGQGGGGGRNEKISAEDLDAELDKYHTEAKETN